jgi:hypothetical protein
MKIGSPELVLSLPVVAAYRVWHCEHQLDSSGSRVP